MHEFIFNRDAYDIVIEKVGQLSFVDEIFKIIQLGKKLWCVCGGSLQRAYDFKLLHTHIHLFVVKYNCVRKLSCLAKSLILEQLFILYASTTQLCNFVPVAES